MQFTSCFIQFHLLLPNRGCQNCHQQAHCHADNNCSHYNNIKLCYKEHTRSSRLHSNQTPHRRFRGCQLHHFKPRQPLYQVRGCQQLYYQQLHSLLYLLRLTTTRSQCKRTQLLSSTDRINCRIYHRSPRTCTSTLLLLLPRFTKSQNQSSSAWACSLWTTLTHKTQQRGS